MSKGKVTKIGRNMFQEDAYFLGEYVTNSDF